MTVKSFGAGVSGYLDPEGRNYELNVVMAGKYVLDVEQNLGQEIAAVRKAPPGTPSGWWCNDFLATDSSTQAIYTSCPGNNQVQFPALSAFVNGWTIPVSYTGVSTGANLVDLGAPPTGLGEKRWDLVVLEAWRRVLTASGTSTGTAGKSGGGRIWRNGNVKVPAADDATLNYVDDILNGLVAQETSKRVQVQYRLRVIQGVNLASYPFGINDPTVVANSVPATAGAPDGVASSYGYVVQSTVGDPGLYRAGNGDPTNALGTADGYMYAIPLMAVARRNTQAFDRNTNHNGGSGRPDGNSATGIVATDLLDLRTGVSPTGWNYQEIGEKNFQFLLDNTLKSEYGNTLIGGGVQGSTVLTAVEIGVSNANGGDGVITGDTPGADFIGQFDGVRRFFSDRPVMETCWVRLTPADAAGSPASWPASGAFTVSLNPATLHVYRHPAIGWTSYVPTGTVILDVMDAYWDPHGIDLRMPAIMGVSGTGALPATNITLTTINTGGYTDSDLMVKVLVSYPAGQGLVRTPGTTYTPVWNNPGSLPGDYGSLFGGTVDAPHRELLVGYQTTTITETFKYDVWAVYPSEFSEISAEASVTLYERIAGSGWSVTVNGDPRLDVELTSPYTLKFPYPGLDTGDDVVVTYQAVRPIQQTGAQLTCYHTAATPQTIKSGILGTSKNFMVRWVSPHVYCLTGGTGSDQEAYPYPLQTAQTGGVYPNSSGFSLGTYVGDHLLRASRVDLDGFGASTGFAKLPAYIPLAATPSGLTMTRVSGDVDLEGRTYFKSVTGSYQPSSFGPGLAYQTAHRVVVPAVVELTSDSTLGAKGQLLLLTFQRWCPADIRNSIEFNSLLTQNYSSTSVYRLKGNLLNNRTGS
jgi:hypothetical protein